MIESTNGVAIPVRSVRSGSCGFFLDSRNPSWCLIADHDSTQRVFWIDGHLAFSLTALPTNVSFFRIDAPVFRFTKEGIRDFNQEQPQGGDFVIHDDGRTGFCAIPRVQGQPSYFVTLDGVVEVLQPGVVTAFPHWRLVVERTSNSTDLVRH